MGGGSSKDGIDMETADTNTTYLSLTPSLRETTLPVAIGDLVNSVRGGPNPTEDGEKHERVGRNPITDH